MAHAGRHVRRRDPGSPRTPSDRFDGGFARHARELREDSGAASLGFLDRRGIGGVFREQREGVRNHGRLLYAPSMFSLWWAERKTACADDHAPAPAPSDARPGFVGRPAPVGDVVSA